MDVKAALSVHQNWRQSLLAALERGEKFTQDQLADEQASPLGQWLYEQGVQQFGDYDEFMNLILLQKKMHQTLGIIGLTLSSLDGPTAQMTLSFSIHFSSTFDAVTQSLEDLCEAVSSGRTSSFMSYQ